jgi:HAD superfamily hydrolase (TIGR01509 family)
VSIELRHGSFASYGALVFDCDGTLVDTMPAHWRAWQVTADKYDLHFSEERFYAWGGVPAPRIVGLLAEEKGLDLDADAVAHDKEMLYAASLTCAEPVHAVVDIARQFRGRKPMAVATGAYRWVCHHALDLVGVGAWFDAIVTFEDVEHPKPAPDTYIEAARRLGIDPGGCVAFEDSEPGLQSARGAGMEVVDVRPLMRRRPHGDRAPMSGST